MHTNDIYSYHTLFQKIELFTYNLYYSYNISDLELTFN